VIIIKVRDVAGSPPQLLPLIQTRRLRFFWHCGTDERLPRYFQSPTYVDSRAAQGLETPPRTSTSHLASDPINADLHPLNHGLNSAWRLAQDRERWRQLVETAMLQPGARSLVTMMMMMMSLALVLFVLMDKTGVIGPGLGLEA